MPHPEFGWVLHLLERYRLETDLRGDGIYAVGRKTGAGAKTATRRGCTHERRVSRIRTSPSTRPRASPRAEFDVRNESAETWRPAEGFAVGYHLFDADTGTLIVDGARVAPPRDVKPGESFHARA